MDIAELINSGRLNEAIDQMKRSLQPQDWSGLNNLAICYRRLGDKPSELRYALDAYSIAPFSPAVLNTLFRALYHSGQYALAARIYNSVADEVELARIAHLIGIHSNLQINRIKAAEDALKRVAPLNDADLEELRTQHAFARATHDKTGAFEVLSKLERLGQVVTDRRTAELFEAGRYQECVDLFLANESGEIRRRSAKAACLAAIMVGDFATASVAVQYGVPESIKKLALSAQAKENFVTVKGELRSYQFPLRYKNLSVAIPHLIGQFYEQGRLTQLAKCLPPRPSVIDIGANIGNHTIFFAGELGATVTPFECNPILLPALKEAIAINDLDRLVDTSFLGSAVTSHCGTVGFDFRREDFSSVVNGSGNAATEVPCLTIDSLKPERVDLLKIDVDGGEIGVLQGARHTLETFRPLVAIEVMNGNIEEALEFFFTRSYAILFEDTRAETHSDFLLIPKENYAKQKFY